METAEAIIKAIRDARDKEQDTAIRYGLTIAVTIAQETLLKSLCKPKQIEVINQLNQTK